MWARILEGVGPGSDPVRVGATSTGQRIWESQGWDQTPEGPASEGHVHLLRGQDQAGQGRRTRTRKPPRIRINGGVRPVCPHSCS